MEENLCKIILNYYLKFRFQEKNSETLKLALSTFSRLNFH